MNNPEITNLIWLDLEMTGLTVDHDRIIEIACVITDPQLNIIAEGPEIVIHQSPAVLALMDAWNQKAHGESGLIQAVQNSRVNEAEAEQKILDFCQQYSAKNTSPMCGNSIYQDRIFLRKYMPKLEAFFHYRNLDVSTLKILTQLWLPAKQYQKPDQSNKLEHRAKYDILISIEELKWYRQNVLNNGQIFK